MAIKYLKGTFLFNWSKFFLIPLCIYTLLHFSLSLSHLNKSYPLIAELIHLLCYKLHDKDSIG